MIRVRTVRTGSSTLLCLQAIASDRKRHEKVRVKRDTTSKVDKRRRFFTIGNGPSLLYESDHWA
jgi:hypothetical protein